jgi:hypothetical protein
LDRVEFLNLVGALPRSIFPLSIPLGVPYLISISFLVSLVRFASLSTLRVEKKQTGSVFVDEVTQVKVLTVPLDGFPSVASLTRSLVRPARSLLSSKPFPEKTVAVSGGDGKIYALSRWEWL